MLWREILTLALVHKTGADQALEQRLEELNGQISSLETVEVSEHRLREKYKNLARIISGLPNDEKRLLSRAIIGEIECSIESRKKTGFLKISFRGDGECTEEVDLTKTQNPEAIASRFHVVWLREQDSNLQ
jgi:hypothetical protein